MSITIAVLNQTGFSGGMLFAGITAIGGALLGLGTYHLFFSPVKKELQK